MCTRWLGDADDGSGHMAVQKKIEKAYEEKKKSVFLGDSKDGMEVSLPIDRRCPIPLPDIHALQARFTHKVLGRPNPPAYVSTFIAQV